MIDLKTRESFKNKTLYKVLELVFGNVNNFEFEKGTISGYSINVWQIEPIKDEGSFLYYDNIEDRDTDWDLLMSLVELDG